MRRIIRLAMAPTTVEIQKGLDSDAREETAISSQDSGAAVAVVMAVATHSHRDCLGGAGALRDAGIPLTGVDLTVLEAHERGDERLPARLFDAVDEQNRVAMR